MIDPKTAPYAATVLRVALGAMFLAHGLNKLLVFTIPGTVGFFESLGLPAVVAYATIAFEVFGGLMLLAGVMSRQVALAGVPLLLGAIALVHGSKGWFFAAEGGGWEYPAFLIAASVAVALLGDGAYAFRQPASRRDLAPNMA